MPGGDRTGPMGVGPLSGRGAGYCAGFDRPGYMNPMPGRGYGFGGGRGFGRGVGRGFGGGGRGRRNMYYATGLPGWARGGYEYPGWNAPDYTYDPAETPEVIRKNELAYLKAQARYAKEELENINKRIDELKASEKEKK